MSYRGLSGLKWSAWCSTVNPQTNCTPEAGICKPMQLTSLTTFKELQRQSNRVAQAQGGTKVPVDGDIGPRTIRAVEGALSRWPVTVRSRYSSCDQLAAVADEVASALQNIADTSGVSKTVSAPSSRKTPPKISSGGALIQTPAAGAFDLRSFITSPFGIAAMALGGILVWQLNKPKRKRAPVKKRGR